MADPNTPKLTMPNGWTLHSHGLKKLLGLPPKLGPAPAVPVYVGTVQGLEIWDCPKGTNGKKGRRAHRLHAKIDGRFVPAGRLHQYRMKGA